MTRRLAITSLIALLAGSASAQTLNLHLSMGPSVPMGGYQLNGTARPPSIGYQVGANVFDVTVNNVDYKVALNAVTFFGLSGALSAGINPCVSKTGALMLCVGVAGDVLNGPEGRGLFNRWLWKENLTFLASCAIPLPDFGTPQL